MNEQEFITAISERSNLSKKDAVFKPGKACKERINK